MLLVIGNVLFKLLLIDELVVLWWLADFGMTDTAGLLNAVALKKLLLIIFYVIIIRINTLNKPATV